MSWKSALYLLLCLVVQKVGPQFFAPETVARLGGMLIGLPATVMGNALPKTLVPLERLARAPAGAEPMRRFVGRTMVLGGVGFMLAYALAPLQIANSLATSLMAIAMIVLGARIVWFARNTR